MLLTIAVTGHKGVGGILDEATPIQYEVYGLPPGREAMFHRDWKAEEVRWKVIVRQNTGRNVGMWRPFGEPNYGTVELALESLQADAFSS